MRLTLTVLLLSLTNVGLARDDMGVRGFDPFGDFYYGQQSFGRGNSGDRLLNTLQSYPDNCKYSFRNWRSSDTTALCQSVNRVLNDQEPLCAPSNCSTATYHALIEKIKMSRKWPAMKSQLMCRPPRGMPGIYSTLIGPSGVLKACDKYGLGQSDQIQRKEMFAGTPKGWPQKGDTVLLQRSRRHGLTGHAVTFTRFHNDGRGGKTICYWSSNTRTKGYGEQCEPISRLDFIQVCRVDMKSGRRSSRNQLNSPFAPKERK